MSDLLQLQAEGGEITTPAAADNQSRTPTFDFLAGLGIDPLEQSDLTRAATAKLLAREVGRLRLDVERLQPYVEKYYEADKRCAVLSERITKATGVVLLADFCLGFGGAALGLGSWMIDRQWCGIGGFTIVLGLLLLAAAIYVQHRHDGIALR